MKITLAGLRLCTCLVIAALACAGPTEAQQSTGKTHGASHVVPNVPDRAGCVKLCELDLNPCDTPIEKKTDGRCTFRD